MHPIMRLSATDLSKCCTAALKVTCVWLLPSVSARVKNKITRSSKSFATSLPIADVRFIARMCPIVHCQG